jgi:hypothetical protein
VLASILKSAAPGKRNESGGFRVGLFQKGGNPFRGLGAMAYPILRTFPIEPQCFFTGGCHWIKETDALNESSTRLPLAI